MCTIYFKGINIVDLTEEYINNGFKEKLLPINTVKKEIKKLLINDENKFYEKKILNQSYAVINQNIYNDKGYYDITKKGNYNCMYCLRNVKDGDSVPFGIPITQEREGDNLVFHCIDIFCSFPCRYAELLLRKKNSLYHLAERLLKNIFTIITGKDAKELKPANDCRLLKIFNGPLDYDEFHNTTSVYRIGRDIICFYPTQTLINKD